MIAGMSVCTCAGLSPQGGFIPELNGQSGSDGGRRVNALWSPSSTTLETEAQKVWSCPFFVPCSHTQQLRLFPQQSAKGLGEGRPSC